MQSRAWSFSRRNRGKKPQQAEEAAPPEGQTKVYFLDGSHKVFDCATDATVGYRHGTPLAPWDPTAVW